MTSEDNGPRQLLDQGGTECRLSSEELRKNEARHRKMVANIGDVIVIIDKEGINCYKSPNIEKWFGWKPEEVVGAHTLENVHSEDKHFTQQFLESLLNEPNAAGTVQCRYRCKDGSYKWIEFTGVNLLHDPDIQGILGNYHDITERKRAEANLKRIEWMLSGKPISNTEVQSETHDQGYGDLAQLNREGIILKSIGRERLEIFANDYMELLGTSSAIYEANGDYAFGIFASGWCRMMDRASRRFCETSDNAEALNSGRWLCHESCWKDCAKLAIAECAPADIECNGGIRMYAVPILANGNVAGAINFGYGDPPKDPEKLRKLAEAYQLDYDHLVREANAYESRPPFIIELAKKRLHATAGLIGAMIETRQAEDALRDSESFIKTVLDHLPIGIAVNSVGPHVEFSYMNENFPKIYRITREALSEPGAFWDVVYEDPVFREKIKHKILEDLSSGDPNRMYWEDVAFTRKGQGPFYICARNIPLEGKQVMISTVWDVTQRKQTEQALQSNYALLQIAGETAGFGGWSVDLEKNICTWSDTVADLHYVPRGYAPPVQEGISFYAPEWREKITQVFSACAEEGIPYDEEMEIITQTGKRVWVRTIGRPVRNEKGKIIKVQGSFQDISEHKRREKALRDSEDRFRAMVEGAPDAVFVQTEKKFAYLNSRAVHLFGAEKETDLLGRPVMERFHPDYHDRIQERIRTLNEERQPVLNRLEQRFLRLDGSEVWVETNGQPIIFEGKKGALVFVRDITEHKQAEAENEKLQSQFIQAQKMESVGRLAGGVAHDFNNMLSIVRGYCEMAMDKVQKQNPLYEDLQEILTAAKRSTEIVRQLLAFARKQTISPGVVDLNETVESMLKMLRRLIGEDIDLAWLPGKQLWLAYIDPSQIDQILANLCVNARDAIDGVGKVTIETGNITMDEAYCESHAGFVPGDFVLLAVSDDGSGMDKETIDNIFEPFFTTKALGQGTGLGLPTVYGIVKQNNGYINVYSEPGKGTTFRIYLPRHVGESDTIEVESKAAILESRGETILLVEDEPVIMRMGKMMLEKMGYAVLAGQTPGEAIRHAEEHAGKIDLLITDVVMPEMNGRQLSEHLCTLYPGLKTLFMSGYTANVIAHRGILEKDVVFIQKPFSIQELSVMVRKALDK